MKTVFTIKIEGGLNNFLGYEILREKDKNECWILQRHLVNKLTIIFDNILKIVKKIYTPETPRRVTKIAGKNDKN